MNTIIFIIVIFLSLVIMAAALSSVITNILDAKSKSDWKKHKN